MWNEIESTDEIKQGDRLRFTYKTTGLTWLTASQLAIVESSLRKKGFQITSVETLQNQIVIECSFEPATAAAQEYQQASIVSGAVIIAAATAIAGVVLWLLVDKIEKWTATTGATITDTIQGATSTPAGQAIMTGSGVFIAGLGIALIWWIFKKK